MAGGGGVQSQGSYCFQAVQPWAPRRTSLCLWVPVCKVELTIQVLPRLTPQGCYESRAGCRPRSSGPEEGCVHSCGASPQPSVRHGCVPHRLLNEQFLSLGDPRFKASQGWSRTSVSLSWLGATGTCTFRAPHLTLFIFYHRMSLWTRAHCKKGKPRKALCHTCVHLPGALPRGGGLPASPCSREGHPGGSGSEHPFAR